VLADRNAFEMLAIPRWAAGPDGRVVAIEAELVSGRRIHHDPEEARGARPAG
jgi:hypothetical protein